MKNLEIGKACMTTVVGREGQTSQVEMVKLVMRCTWSILIAHAMDGLEWRV